MSKVKVVCFLCNKPVEKLVTEVNRNIRLGRQMFCSLSCVAKQRNSSIKSKEFILNCLCCGKQFKTSTKKKSAKHCSRSCASKNSVTDKRRETARRLGVESNNLISVDEALKKREAWKYAALKDVLVDRAYEFEYPLGGYVYDLALFDDKILIEFDGPNHADVAQKQIDDKKDSVAISHGFFVVRRSVAKVAVISPEILEGLI
jgi:very-short-patch-repair endonuclease